MGFRLGSRPAGRSGSCWGLILCAGLLSVALLAPWLAPYRPWQRFMALSPPSRLHLLGTNDIGNDILTELIFGAQTSLVTGFGAGLIATLLGLGLGLAAGYYRGWRDQILMGLTDVFLMIPRLPLLITLAALLQPNRWWTMLLMGVLWWPTTARVVRSKTLQVRETGFIRSAICLGLAPLRILTFEILPNILLVVIPKFLLTVASAMIAEASVSFLGLGDPTVKSWGMMLNYAFTKGGFANEMWWWIFPPACAVSLSVLAPTWAGDALEAKLNEMPARIE
jgi:peptide/nickel transport system permease protein